MSTVAVGRRTRLQPEERRAQLLKCALEVFAEHGIARATHSHVAERAGVSVPTVHAYFRTRDDLVAAVLGVVGAYLDGITKPLEAEATPYEALMALGRTFVQKAEDDPDIIRVWLDWSTGVGLDVWPDYLATLDRMHKAVETVLERGRRTGAVPEDIDIRAAAQIYIGGGHTVALMTFAGRPKDEIDRSIVQLVGVMFKIQPDAAPKAVVH